MPVTTVVRDQTVHVGDIRIERGNLDANVLDYATHILLGGRQAEHLKPAVHRGHEMIVGTFELATGARALAAATLDLAAVLVTPAHVRGCLAFEFGEFELAWD